MTGYMKDSLRLQVPTIPQKLLSSSLPKKKIPLNKSISSAKNPHSLSELPKETNLKQCNLFG